MTAPATELLDGRARVVRVMGEVDVAAVKGLERALLDADGSRTGAVIIDLGDCTLLDASGLMALVETMRRFERARRRPALVLSAPRLLSIFQITRLDQEFEIHPSLDAALDD